MLRLNQLKNLSVLNGAVVFCACMILGSFVLSPCSAQEPNASAAPSESMRRLMRKAEMIPAEEVYSVLEEATEVAPPSARRASYTPPVKTVGAQIAVESEMIDHGFPARNAGMDSSGNFAPVPMQRGIVMPHRPLRMPGSRHRDEYLFDGDDRGKRLSVDQSWNIYGMDTEDTFGHFDTLSGQRLVSPSNRVAIYSPRFAAVRKVESFVETTMQLKPGSIDKDRVVITDTGKHVTASSKQHLQVERQLSTSRPSSFSDRTRGVTADNTTHLFGIRNSFKPFENLTLIKFGRLDLSESARAEIGMQAANVWQDNLGLQVANKNVKAIITNDFLRLQQVSVIDTDGDNALLRVTKVASRSAAAPGELVDFTIRFDNIGIEPIGNVTIVDNLTSRLEYVPNSATSSLDADFINTVNDAGSLTLRWEIRAPLPRSQGGVIKFTCRVR